jgi:hypothetical protein
MEYYIPYFNIKVKFTSKYMSLFVRNKFIQNFNINTNENVNTLSSIICHGNWSNNKNDIYPFIISTIVSTLETF